MALLLIVEDDKLHREMLVDYAEMMGFDAQGVSSKESAITAMEVLPETPIAVITDLNLTRDDEQGGVQVLEYLKQNVPNVIRVLYTGSEYSGNSYHAMFQKRAGEISDVFIFIKERLKEQLQ